MGRNKVKKSAAKPNKTASRIKSNVAEINERLMERPFSVGFKYFDDACCVLKDVHPKVSRKIHEIYRKIGSCFQKQEVRSLPYDIKPINNSNHYTKYFKNVTEDTEVHEFDVGVCRGFFFFDTSHQIVQILAIDHHPEKKNKR